MVSSLLSKHSRHKELGEYLTKELLPQEFELEFHLTDPRAFGHLGKKVERVGRALALGVEAKRSRVPRGPAQLMLDVRKRFAELEADPPKDRREGRGALDSLAATTRRIKPEGKPEALETFLVEGEQALEAKSFLRFCPTSRDLYCEVPCLHYECRLQDDELRRVLELLRRAAEATDVPKDQERYHSNVKRRFEYLVDWCERFNVIPEGFRRNRSITGSRNGHAAVAANAGGEGGTVVSGKESEATVSQDPNRWRVDLADYSGPVVLEFSRRPKEYRKAIRRLTTESIELPFVSLEEAKVLIVPIGGCEVLADFEFDLRTAHNLGNNVSELPVGDGTVLVRWEQVGDSEYVAFLEDLESIKKQTLQRKGFRTSEELRRSLRR